MVSSPTLTRPETEASRLQDEIDDLEDKLDGKIEFDAVDAVDLAEWVLARSGAGVEWPMIRDVAERLLRAGRKAGRG